MSYLPDHLKKLFPHEDRWGLEVGYQLVSHAHGKVQTKLPTESRHQSPSGAVHGGVLSCFADWSMGAAVFTILKPGQLTSTIEFKINYLSPVQVGETIYCDAKIKHAGKSHAVVEFHIFREEGKDIAVGVGTYNLYTKSSK